MCHPGAIRASRCAVTADPRATGEPDSADAVSPHCTGTVSWPEEGRPSDAHPAKTNAIFMLEPVRGSTAQTV